MKVKVELEVVVHDPEELKKHVYQTMYPGTPADEVDSEISVKHYDDPVSAMVMEVLVANGTPPLDMGVEIMNYDAKVIN